jgi:hypothetical protein
VLWNDNHEVLAGIGESKVLKNDDGTISVDDLKDLNGEPKTFREIGPLMFRDVNGQDRIAFKRENSGKPILVIDLPFMVFEKADSHQSSVLNLPLIIGSDAVLVLTLLLWPVAALVRQHYGKKTRARPQQRRLRLLVRIVRLLDLIFFAAFAGLMSMGLSNVPRSHGT